MKILLLEPDEYYHQQFSDRMGPDFEIIPAKSLEAAQTALRELEPEVLVTELLLEDGASFPVIEELRFRKNNAAVPVIVFSQIDNLKDMEHALSLGVSGYFVKGKDTVSDVHRLLLTFNPVK